MNVLPPPPPPTGRMCRPPGNREQRDTHSPIKLRRPPPPALGLDTPLPLACTTPSDLARRGPGDAPRDIAVGRGQELGEGVIGGSRGVQGDTIFDPQPPVHPSSFPASSAPAPHIPPGYDPHGFDTLQTPNTITPAEQSREAPWPQAGQL